MKNKTILISFLITLISFSSFAQTNNEKFETAIKYTKKYQRVQAREIFNEIIKSDPNFLDAYYQRGKINAYYKKDSLAILDFNVVANKHQDTEKQAEAHIAILDLLFKNEESCSTQSKVHIDALKTLDAESYKASLYDGICKLHSGEAQEAVNQLTKAYNADEENKTTLYYRARAEIDINNYITAVEDLNKVIEAKPKFGDAYFWRAYAYYELAVQPEEKHAKKYLHLALDDLNMAIKRKVRAEEAYYDRAEIKFELQDYEGAIADFKKVISKNPNNLDAHYQKAICYYHYGQEYSAIKEFKTIIKKDSTYADAFYNLAVIYHGNGKLEEAIKYADKALALDHEHADAYVIRGDIYLAQGNKEMACADYSKADEFGDTEAHKDVKKYCK